MVQKELKNVVVRSKKFGNSEIVIRFTGTSYFIQIGMKKFKVCEILKSDKSWASNICSLKKRVRKYQDRII